MIQLSAQLAALASTTNCDVRVHIHMHAFVRVCVCVLVRVCVLFWPALCYFPLRCILSTRRKESSAASNDRKEGRESERQGEIESKMKLQLLYRHYNFCEKLI